MARPTTGIEVRVDGLRELRRDLRAIDRKLPAQLNTRLKAVVQSAVLPDAKRFATVTKGRIAKTLKVGTRGSSVVIRSRHPGARTVHFGGRHPLFGDRDHWYQQKPRPFVSKALAGKTRRVEAELMDTVEDVMTQAGFRR